MRVLTCALVLAVFACGSSASAYSIVTFPDTTAQKIIGLEADGVFWDVEFRLTTFAVVLPDDLFPFLGDKAGAIEAGIAIADVLNAEAIIRVGPDNEDRFRIPHGIQTNVHCAAVPQYFVSRGVWDVTMDTNNCTDASSAVVTYAVMTASAVPIPPAVWLFGSALGLLGWIRRSLNIT